MVLRFFLLASAFLLISCTDFVRDNPTDPDSINYVPPIVPSSSSGTSSSSSAPTQSGIIRGTPVYYEGENYETVVIGTQTWMARNLNYDAPGSKCNNCATYGRLYDWETAMNLPGCNSNSCSSQIGTKHRGICPTGWYIPSNDDWDKLENYVESSNGCSSCAARYLKATDGWYNNGNGNDQYGFSALPGGIGGSGGSFNYVGDLGHWWSSSEYGSNFAYRRTMYYRNEDVGCDSYYKDDLRSVRCLQD